MMNEVLVVGSILLSSLLAFVSFVAYRRSRMRATLYLSFAFLLWACKKFVELGHTALWIRRDVGNIVDALELLILLLILAALWKR